MSSEATLFDLAYEILTSKHPPFPKEEAMAEELLSFFNTKVIVEKLGKREALKVFCYIMNNVEYEDEATRYFCCQLVLGHLNELLALGLD